VINKIDIPEVRAKLDDLTKQIKKIAGHSRVIGISAATGERVKELMQRVRKVVDALPSQSDFELFTEEEDRVSFEDETSDKFEIFTDERFPGQFRVAGDKIEKVKTVVKHNTSKCFILYAAAFISSWPIVAKYRFGDFFNILLTVIYQVVQTMNWDYYESVLRFQRILDAQGISEALKECGAKEGDLVMIGKAKSAEDRLNPYTIC
jgi:GTP-binding protein